MVRLPVHDRSGRIVAHAAIDAEDAPLVAGERWTLHSKGYATSKKRYLHRVLLGVTDRRTEVDHINHDPLDNRRANLRLATRAQNAQNMGRRPEAFRSSRYRGVSWHPQNEVWNAHGTLNGRKHHLGCFLDELDAAHAARDWRRRNMPFSVEEKP